MKKNISINISGIIFHIEEDGYDRLKKYLDSINRYFSSYQGSEEIIADIESRIAEIFLSKLKEGGKQVIALEDVEHLISVMGSIKDFKAAEEPPETELESEPEEKTGEPDDNTETGPEREYYRNRLYRDKKRKLISGVASGIAYYLGIDPLWIRLLFILLFLPFFVNEALSIISVLIYIILWIVTPEAAELPEEKKYKKMFRNPDEKVLGGVAGGIAAYFGIDMVVVRLLFVISIFLGGSGILLYIILWIILPEAKTITEKVEMQGNPVTLTNIESNIKKSLHVEDEKESTVVKVLLFPFRLIATIINGISKSFGPFLKFLVELIRVLAGALLLIIAVTSIFGLITSLGVIMGILNQPELFYLQNFPIEIIKNSIPVLTTISAFISSLLPFVLLIILGLTVITKQKLLKATVGWSLFALWIISSLIFGISIIPIVRDFQMTGQIEQTQQFIPQNETIYLKVSNYEDNLYESVKLQIRGHEDSVITLIKKIQARGKNSASAELNANMISYQVSKRDSVMYFSTMVEFADGATFRLQEVDLTLYIPYGQHFVMDNNLREILRNTLYYYGYHSYQLDNNVWMFSESGLNCITCEQYSEDDSTDNNLLERLETKEFDEVSAGDIFKLKIRSGDEYSVDFMGSDVLLKNTILRNENGKLSLILARKLTQDQLEDHYILITSPKLDQLELSGGCNAEIIDLVNNKFTIKLSDAASANVSLTTQDFDIMMDGVATMNITGEATHLTGKINSAAKLNALDLVVENANIRSEGAATINLFVKKILEVDAQGKSTINYKGNPEVKSNISITSSVKKLD